MPVCGVWCVLRCPPCGKFISTVDIAPIPPHRTCPRLIAGRRAVFGARCHEALPPQGRPAVCALPCPAPCVLRSCTAIWSLCRVSLQARLRGPRLSPSRIRWTSCAHAWLCRPTTTSGMCLCMCVSVSVCHGVSCMGPCMTSRIAHRFPGLGQALVMSVRTEGFWSLYRGLLPTLLGVIPYAGTRCACHEHYVHRHYCTAVSSRTRRLRCRLSISTSSEACRIIYRTLSGLCVAGSPASSHSPPRMSLCAAS